MSKQEKRRIEDKELARYARSVNIPYRGNNNSKAVLAAAQSAYGSPRCSVLSAAVRLTSRVQFPIICLRYASAFRIGWPLVMVGLPALGASQNSAQLPGPFTAFSHMVGFAPLLKKPRTIPQQKLK